MYSVKNAVEAPSLWITLSETFYFKLMFNRNEASTAWKEALWHCTQTLPPVGVLPLFPRVVLLAVIQMIQQDPVRSCRRSVT